MTYWIVITMIFVAILAVALATSLSESDNGAVADDDASIEEGSFADDHD